jgi:hypothetical protein
MSNGESVPEVMTTLLKRSKTGLMANEGSRHLECVKVSNSLWRGDTDTHTKWKIGFGTVALSVSNGSRIKRKPAVELRKCEEEEGEKSSTFLVCGYQRRKIGNLLQGRVFIQSAEFQRLH